MSLDVKHNKSDRWSAMLCVTRHFQHVLTIHLAVSCPSQHIFLHKSNNNSYTATQIIFRSFENDTVMITIHVWFWETHDSGI